MDAPVPGRSTAAHPGEPRAPIVPSGRNRETVAGWHDTGADCRKTMDSRTFRHELDAVDHCEQPAIWYARLGLCHGLVFGAGGRERLRAACQVVADTSGS